jgi:hypothetical protein
MSDEINPANDLSKEDATKIREVLRMFEQAKDWPKDFKLINHYSAEIGDNIGGPKFEGSLEARICFQNKQNTIPLKNINEIVFYLKEHLTE